MVSIYIKEISQLANRIVELYKTKYGLRSKDNAIEKMILTFSKEFKQEELNRDWRTDPATDKQRSLLKSIKINIPKDTTKLEADKLIKENKDKLK